jgi:hypothetical protein
MAEETSEAVTAAGGCPQRRRTGQAALPFVDDELLGVAEDEPDPEDAGVVDGFEPDELESDVDDVDEALSEDLVSDPLPDPALSLAAVAPWASARLSVR